MASNAVALAGGQSSCLVHETANYSRLGSLPFTSLKMCEDRLGREIATSILSLGRGLNVHVIAEGVETEEQAPLLSWVGFPFGQGFLFSKGAFAGQLQTFIQEFQKKRRDRSVELELGNLAYQGSVNCAVL